jgi:hypothetical protein
MTPTATATPTLTRLAALVTTLLATAALTAACGSTATKTSSQPTSASTTAATTATAAPSATVGASGGGGTVTTASGAPATTAATTSTTTAGMAACASDGLHLAASGPSNPGAGSATWTLMFTNAGQAPCSLDGYPGVSAISSSGQQIGQPAGRTGRSPSVVVVQPGQSATADVRIAQAGDFDPSACGTPTAASGFRVYPPGQTAALSAAASFLSICSGSAVQMQVNPVTS